MTVVGVLAALSLAACGQQAEQDAPPPAEVVSAVNPASGADVVAPVVLTAADLRRVCQVGLAEIHGQDPSDIQIDGVEGRVVNASWRAPVDGGRRRAQCRVDGDIVTWKPVDATNPGENRWMNQAGDPVTRYIFDPDNITINTTLPDGTTATETYSQGAV